ncbi:hypothetical protein AGRA671_26160 [Agrobacterium radiobacter]|nr:hypothetical protein A6U90_09870 [Agrobacterium tumefaciens]
MTPSFVERLRDSGFTHISFDLSKAVTITAWRKTERKTYSAYMAPSLAAAEAHILAQLKPEPDFSDVLG